MYCYKYPHPAVTVDCLVFRKEEGRIFILLIKRGKDPYKDFWAFPGGFINYDETAEEAVVREIKEETDLDLEEVKQLHTYTNPERDPRERVITIAFYSFTDKSEINGGDDAAEAKWFPIDHLPSLAFDHSQIFSDAMQDIRDKYFSRPSDPDME